MGLSLRVCRGVVVAVVALAVSVVSGAVAVAEATVAESTVTETGSAVRVSTSGAMPAVDPLPVPGGSVPSESDVSEARAAAAAAAREVAEITAEVERAEARLQTLQRGVSEAVSAQETAQQHLADAEAAVLRAAEALAAAHRARDAADRALSGRAAVLYMQGGDLENLTTLVLAPPGVMSDLAVVLDQNAQEVRNSLDAARFAAADAAARERLLTTARDSRALAAEDAAARRAAAEKEAAQAGAEAATLGEQQAALTARLAELEQGAADLEGLREAAARLGRDGILGVQAAGSLGSGPRAAQEIARSMMPSYGWDAAEFTCLLALWHAESGWSWSASNPSSGAYGIPQSLPGWKMASAGGDWLTNPATQITWGLGYIESRYGSPCSAYDQFLARSPHWY